MSSSGTGPGAQHTVPKPEQIAALPRNTAGYPIPFFAALVDGERTLLLADPAAWRACVDDHRCWICGRDRGWPDAFILGPIGIVNRTTQEPPSCVQCAEYAVLVCPFLARPDMVRRKQGLPEHRFTAGIAVERNLGVAAIWIATDWKPFHPRPGRQEMLLELGDPVSVSWWTQGRPATRGEAITGLHTGLQLLVRQCQNDGDRLALLHMLTMAALYLPSTPQPPHRV